MVIAYGAARQPQLQSHHRCSPAVRPLCLLLAPVLAFASPLRDLDLEKKHADTFRCAVSMLDVVRKSCAGAGCTHWAQLVNLLPGWAKAARQQDAYDLDVQRMFSPTQRTMYRGSPALARLSDFVQVLFMPKRTSMLDSLRGGVPLTTVILPPHAHHTWHIRTAPSSVL
ncbi:hypothetical protein B0H12DRAFT_749412 [Mycena haematopus]|nr:hypothetical protein B0H12DRAFT_749412 [Mycena haematopus]